MSRVIRLSLVSGFVALFAVVSIVPAAHAQRRSGSYGFNNSNNNNSNKNNNNQGFNQNQSQNSNQSDQDDDDNDNNKKNKNRNSNRNNNSSNNSNNQQNNNQQNNNQQNNNQQNKNSNSQQQMQQLLQGQGGNKQGNNFNQQNQSNSQQFQNKKLQSNQQFPNFQQQQNNWQQKKWQGPHNVDVWTKQYNNGPKPFSKKWYDDHPKAWYHDHDHWDDNVWIVATTPGIGAWLGWDNYPHNNTVVYGYYPGVNQQQIVDPAIFGEWFPLGVYSLMTGPYDNGTRMLQLAVDRQGNLSGTYYDMITDTSHRVSGRIRQNSQRASWSLDTNDQLTFYAPLDQLTQQQGIVSVQMPGGEQQWQIVRLQNYGN